MKLFSLIRTTLKAIKAIYNLSERIKSLDETMIASALLSNTKPIITDSIDSLSLDNISSPLLKDWVISHNKFKKSISEVIIGKDSREITKIEEDKKLHQAWSEMRKDVVGE